MHLLFHLSPYLTLEEIFYLPFIRAHVYPEGDMTLASKCGLLYTYLLPTIKSKLAYNTIGIIHHTTSTKRRFDKEIIGVFCVHV